MGRLGRFSAAPKLLKLGMEAETEGGGGGCGGRQEVMANMNSAPAATLRPMPLSLRDLTHRGTRRFEKSPGPKPSCPDLPVDKGRQRTEPQSIEEQHGVYTDFASDQLRQAHGFPPCNTPEFSHAGSVTLKLQLTYADEALQQATHERWAPWGRCLAHLLQR